MKEDLYIYDILSRIYKESGYASRALNSARGNVPFISRTVYGILEKDTYLEYVISALVPKRPKPSVVILLKMGLYYVAFTDSLPDYAAVNRVLDCAQEVGKGALKGLINATLKRYIAESVQLPQEKVKRLSVESSVPLWLVKKYVRQYGFDVAQTFLKAPTFTRQHIRPNLRKTDLDGLCAFLDGIKVGYTKGEFGCFVDWGKKLVPAFNDGLFTMQSLTSVLCCHAAGVKDGDKVLDLCSAPGGKAIYLSELADIEIKCSDIHSHRLALIASYAERMGAQGIDYVLADAAKDCFGHDAYDVVMCDVPCSGFGVAKSKPDVYLHRKESDIPALAATQRAILNNAGKYVKSSGVIVYSTCTLLKEENSDIVAGFLADNKNFTVVSETQYLPDGNGTDGFYVAVIRRTE